MEVDAADKQRPLTLISAVRKGEIRSMKSMEKGVSGSMQHRDVGEVPLLRDSIDDVLVPRHQTLKGIRITIIGTGDLRQQYIFAYKARTLSVLL
jgi:hypothetical protein